MYEDIYKGLSEEDRQRLIKDDIPKFETIGTFEMTEKEKIQARKDLLRFIEEDKEAMRKRKATSQ